MITGLSKESFESMCQHFCSPQRESASANENEGSSSSLEVEALAQLVAARLQAFGNSSRKVARALLVET